MLQLEAIRVQDRGLTLRNVVGLAMDDDPAVLATVVLRNVLATELLHLLLSFAVHLHLSISPRYPSTSILSLAV